MVERLAEIQARIANLGDLQDIMGAMRAMAAMRLSQAQNALPGIRQYTEVINFGLARGLALTGTGGRHARPGARGRLAVVAFTSEHGFAGAYNEHVLHEAWQLAKGGGSRLLVVGSRGKVKAEEHGCKVAYAQPMATHVDGVLEVVLRCADEIYRRLAADGVERLTLVYGRNTTGALWKVEVEPVLPFDVSSYARADVVAPMVYLDPHDLFDKLVEEFVFTRLTHAAMESFASENAARLTAMEAAHDNIETKVETLTQQARQQRQEEITTELLDVVIGATAARKD